MELVFSFCTSSSEQKFQQSVLNPTSYHLGVLRNTHICTHLMYACMYVYMYVCMYVCMNVYMHVCVCV